MCSSDLGTVYRRFPDKAQLIDGLFEQRLADLLALMKAAVADPDAWHGLTTFLRQALELQAADRGLKDLIHGTPEGLKRVSRIRQGLLPLSAELVRRAHEQGTLRQDITAPDFAVAQLMVSTLIDASREVQPELWRRYLAIVLRGLSADPEAMPPLEIGRAHV